MHTNRYLRCPRPEAYWAIECKRPQLLYRIGNPLPCFVDLINVVGATYADTDAAVSALLVVHGSDDVGRLNVRRGAGRTGSDGRLFQINDQLSVSATCRNYADRCR